MKIRRVLWMAGVIGLTAASVVTAFGWWSDAPARPKLSLVSVNTRLPPTSTHSPALRVASMSPLAATDTPALRSAVRVGTGSELLESGKFIADLDREIHLTEQQRGDLAQVLRQMATMQARIDLHEDPDEREDMQDKLIHQLIVRLRMILGEENAKSTVVTLVETKPRILYEQLDRKDIP